ncbi:hypothetical protein WMF20_45155 [Sorangium sp. So ce834]|uniref:hypothetical protein n=1 Tax=Sorangium sp. So ce834 TaxID=3133321 RepID=UPI003F62DE6A
MVAATAEDARFGPEGDRDTREAAAQVASSSLREMSGEARQALFELDQEVPRRLGTSLIGVKGDIESARDRALDAIDAAYAAATRAAHRDARAAKGVINAQYVASAVHAVTTTVAAMGRVQSGAARTTRAIGSAENAELGVVRTLIARGQLELIGVGTSKGGEAMNLGRSYWRMYHRGRINQMDNALDGYLTDRRADARANAAMETAKGYRDGFVNEAAAQARQLARARAGHCATVISSSLGAQDGVQQGAAQAVGTLGQMMTGALAAAAAQRQARTASVDAQLANQLRQLAGQRHAQRQAARDTAYLQRLMVESAAHGVAGELLRGAAQAGRGIADALAQLRAVLEVTTAPRRELARATMRGVHGRVTLLLGQLRERLGSGLDTAVSTVEASRGTARGALDRLVETARDGARQLTQAFAEAMGQASSSAVEGFTQARTEHATAIERLTTTVQRTFACALLTVVSGYIRLNQGIREGIDQQKTSLQRGFDLQIQGGVDPEGGGRKPGLAADIRKYACIAAQNERPAWETVVTILLVILIAIVVSVLLGPVIGAAVGGLIGAGLLATVITGIIVGAIAGALSSMAGYLVGNALAGRRSTGRGLWHAAWTGALTGAIGGGIGAFGGALVNAAGQAGATALSRFAITLAFDMVSEYASQVVMNAAAGKGLASFTELDLQGFLLSGAISSASFLHAARGARRGGGADAARAPHEAGPAAPREAGPAAPREAGPAAPREAAPTAERSTAPREAAPAAPREAAPQGREMAPPPRDAAPSSPRETSPAASHDGTPAAPPDGVPAAPREATPATARDAAPQGPHDPGPGAPRDGAPAQRPSTHRDAPPVDPAEPGVVGREPAGGSHDVKVTRDGQIWVCSDCGQLRHSYAEELAGAPKLHAELVRIEAIPNPQAKAQAAARLHARLLGLRNLASAHAPGRIAGGADATVPRQMRTIGDRFGRSEANVAADMQHLLRTGEHPPGVHPESPYGQALLRLGESVVAPAPGRSRAPRPPLSTEEAITAKVEADRTVRQGLEQRGTEIGAERAAAPQGTGPRLRGARDQVADVTRNPIEQGTAPMRLGGQEHPGRVSQANEGHRVAETARGAGNLVVESLGTYRTIENFATRMAGRLGMSPSEFIRAFIQTIQTGQTPRVSSRAAVQARAARFMSRLQRLLFASEVVRSPTQLSDMAQVLRAIANEGDLSLLRRLSPAGGERIPGAPGQPPVAGGARGAPRAAERAAGSPRRDNAVDRAADESIRRHAELMQREPRHREMTPEQLRATLADDIVSFLFGGRR